jgi:hypothetical protein
MKLCTESRLVRTDTYRTVAKAVVWFILKALAFASTEPRTCRLCPRVTVRTSDFRCELWNFWREVVCLLPSASLQNFKLATIRNANFRKGRAIFEYWRLECDAV